MPFSKQVYNFASILGMTPFYDFNKKTLRRSTWFKCYSLCLCLIITMATVWSVKVKVENRYLPLPTQIFLDYTTEACLLGIYLVSALGACFWHKKDWEKFISMLTYLDQILKEDAADVKRSARSIRFRLFIGHVIFAFCWVLEEQFGVWKVDTLIYVPHILDSILYYCVYYASALTNMNLIRFRNKYRYLNRMLSNCLKAEKGDAVQSIREVGKIYRFLGQTVDLFNETFGWILIFLMANSFIRVLSSLNLAFTGKYLKPEQVDVTITYTISSMFISFSIIMIMNSSDYMTKEAENAIELCHVLQEDLKSSSEARKELLILAKRIESKIPRCTAAGFFNVNRNTLMGVLGTLTTYLIVVIQFNSNFFM